MPIIFYYLSGSPFSWKIWLCLEHKQLSYEVRNLSAEGGDLKSVDFLKINPRGKVPVIVDNGRVVCESSVIIEYLEEQYPASGHSLWPKER
jgi:glutathione S-transferase